MFKRHGHLTTKEYKCTKKNPKYTRDLKLNNRINYQGVKNFTRWLVPRVPHLLWPFPPRVTIPTSHQPHMTIPPHGAFSPHIHFAWPFPHCMTIPLRGAFSPSIHLVWPFPPHVHLMWPSHLLHLRATHQSTTFYFWFRSWLNFKC